MKTKLAKAYWTAWRWPEVYTDSVSVIWTSRVLAVALPLGLTLTTLLTGIAAYGIVAAVLVTGILVGVILLVTTHLFYEEHGRVKQYTDMDAQVRSFFLGFPQVTALPIIERRNGEWVSYGHIGKEDFLAAVADILRSVTEDEGLILALTPDPDTVEYQYATFTNPEEDHWDEGIDLCHASVENCFPITRARARTYVQD